MDETELKLEVTASGADKFAASDVMPGKPSRIKQHSVYFDTADQMLAKAGLSLRIRRSNGAYVQTIKAAGSSAAGLFVRTEWEQSVDDSRPILDETTPIFALLRGRAHEIRPIFEVNIDRRIWVVEEEKSRIEVSLDRGEVVAGDRRSQICEIELELKGGDAAVLYDLARRIDAIAAVRLGVLSKAERGYRLREAVVNAVKAEPITLESDMAVGVAFQRIANACLRQFRLNEAMIGNQNPEALHQARVGLRRLLSAMAIFKPVLEDEDLPLLRDSLRWLVGELGAARNLDVLAARATTGALHARLEAARNNAYANVLAVSESARARALMISLAEWIANGRWLSHPDASSERNETLKSFARAILKRLRKKLKKSGNLTELDDEQRHQVRKNAKKLRYASEFFASLFDGNTAQRRQKHFIRALERLQNELGLLNDLAMAPSVLKELGLGDSLPAQLGLSDRTKPELLNAAAEAHDDLLDTKRFWS